MAPRSVSPGQALLRASRMFAVPAPLKAPQGGLGSSINFDSDTATLPYPIHLTLATPKSSLSRGDWGLKRSLPLRSTTRTSTPLVRVKAMDTYEHVTEFASASDHTLTLEKWQELNMPLTTPPMMEKGVRTFFGGKVKQAGRGVFEEAVDITTKNPVKEVESQRWKYEGPWLAGQTEGQFNTWMLKTVRKRRSAFRAYLRNAYAVQLNKAAQEKAAQEEGDPPRPVRSASITDNQLREYIRQLRHERVELFAHIRNFLDLPPAPEVDESILSELIMSEMESGNTSGFNPRTIDMKTTESVFSSPYAENGPPKTHPSAGLSYLRTGSTMENHPVHGPQASQTPIQGRVILPREAAVGAFGAQLGVAGLVADVPPGNNTSFKTSLRKGQDTGLPNLINIEPSIKGGGKVELVPNSAMINAEGRIVFRVLQASDASVAVRDENLDFFNRRAELPQISRNSGVGGGQHSRGYGLSSGRDRVDVFGDRARAAQEAQWKRPTPRDSSPSSAPRTEVTDKAQAYRNLETMLDDPRR